MDLRAINQRVQALQARGVPYLDAVQRATDDELAAYLDTPTVPWTLTPHDEALLVQLRIQAA